jgi:cytochrome oxidase Cu insertion factor (SCO1/SenC/PrrC family)
MSNVIIPSNPTERKKVFDAIREIDASKTRIEAEQDHIKAVLIHIEEEHELPKKYMRKVAAAYHKQNIDQMTSDSEEVESIYDALCKVDGT